VHCEYGKDCKGQAVSKKCFEKDCNRDADPRGAFYLECYKKAVQTGSMVTKQNSRVEFKYGKHNTSANFATSQECKADADAHFAAIESMEMLHEIETDAIMHNPSTLSAVHLQKSESCGVA